MLSPETIDKIEEIINKGNDTLEVDGLEYVPTGYKLHKTPLPKPVSLLSLNSFVDACHALVGAEGEVSENMMIHVESPTKVELISKTHENDGQRLCLAEADVDKFVNNFKYGSDYDQEDFLISLRSNFVDDENRKKLIDVASKVSNKEEATLEDNGITQTVSARGGVHLETMMELPNKIILKPFKSFPEIEPVEEEFIFRVKKGRHGTIGFKLYDSGSMKWEMDTAAVVKNKLKEMTKITVV